MTTATSTLQERYARALMPNYGMPALALERGDGCVVWDVDGNSYLDLVGGIAVSALGHAHPAIVAAVCDQVARLAHVSNLYLHEGQVRLAERLLGLLGADGRVFFANSGTEANEAALKLVRRAQGPDRPVVVAAEGGFHGRTMGSLGLTGKSSIREPFAPFGVQVRFVPYGDRAALDNAIRPDCAAMFIEPWLGEGGVVPAPPGYLHAARAACDSTGTLLVLDEIQSGIGRTGAWFACQAAGIKPDVITLAKGLGGGLPIGACIGMGPAGTVLAKGDHGSTFGGNPVACAAALAVLDIYKSEGLFQRGRELSPYFLDMVFSLQDVGIVTDIRGYGMFATIDIQPAGAPGARGHAFQKRLFDNGLHLKNTGDSAIIAPPLIAEKSHIDMIGDILRKTLAQI